MHTKYKMLFLKLFLIFLFHLAVASSSFTDLHSRLAAAHAANCAVHTVTVTCTGRNVLPQSSSISKDKRDYRFDNNSKAFHGALNEHNFQDYVSMQWLSLRYNKLTTVGAKSFRHSWQLATIDLSFNSIKKLPATLFRNNTALKHFYCSNNLLTTIDQHIFQGLTMLTHVRLQNNRLAVVHPQAFASIVSLQELYLEQNRLETAYWSWIGNFNSSSRSSAVELDSNKWSCDCRMLDFFKNLHKAKWIHSAKGKDSTCGSGCRIDFPRCHSPPELVGKRLSDLYKKQLICSKPSFTGRKQFNFNEGENQNLTCQGKGKPTPKIKILTESGEVLAHGTGSVRLILHPVEQNHAGKYVCLLSGFNSNHIAINTTQEVRLKVTPKNTSAAGVIIAILIIVFLALGVSTCLWRRSKKREGYGSLTNDGGSIYYELENGASSANESTPALQPTALEEDPLFSDEEVYAKTTDDDKEVLV